MKKFLIIFLALLTLSGCAPREEKASETIFCMDTVMDIQIWGQDAQTALKQVKTLLQELEATWSANDGKSFLAALNRGEVKPNAEQQALLDRAEELSRYTGGAFDPKLLSLMQLWGFASEIYHVPDEAEIKKVMKDGRWDLGALIKGYAAERIVQLLEPLKVSRAVMNLGGNVQTYGNKPDGTAWRVAIQNPNGGDPVGMVSVEGSEAVVTSGNYQRYFIGDDGKRYHHILDPQTGAPADNELSSVTVLCADGAKADALSTALFVMGLEKGSAFWRQNPGFEVVFVTQTGEVYATEGVDLSHCEFEVLSRED